MADKIEIEIELDPVLGAQAKNKIVKESGKAGKKSGKKFSKQFSGEFKKSTKFLFAGLGVGVIATIVAFKKLINTSKEFVQLAGVQQDAINELNSSLKRSGKFTVQASKDFQAFASQLQQNSTIGDEVILKNAALIQSLGALSVEGLKQATQAAADLSAALGIDLTAAATLVGKAAVGEVGSFSRYGLVIKKGKTAAETFAKALTALQAKFGGAAQAQTKTFTGALEQLSNTFGDLKETVGEVTTDSPAVINLFKFLSKEILKAQASLRGLQQEGDVLRGVLRGFANAGIFVFNLLKPFEIFGNVLVSIFRDLPLEIEIQLKTLEVIMIGGLQRLGTKLSGIPFLANNPITKFLRKLNTDVGTELAQLQKTFNENIDGVFNADFSDKAIAFAERLRASLAPVAEVATETAGFVTFTLGSIVAETETQIGLGFAAFKVGMDNTAATAKNTGKQLATALKSGLVRAATSGIQSLTESLLKGEAGFKEFGVAILGVLADMAVQMGGVLIGAGLGIESLKALGGAAAIAAGVGLIALGTIIKSLIGGGAGASAGGGAVSGGAVGGGTVSDEIIEDEAVAETPETTAVNVVIQGDVLDSEESGLRIANILNDAFDKQGVVVKGAVA